MTGLTSQPWFGWARAIVVGLPVLMFALTELQLALVRRGSSLARPVSLLRNFALPAGALLLLLTKASQISSDETWVRIVATVFGFLVVLLVLSALNVALFSHATPGSWRQRMPSIFVDIARLILIVVGLGVLFRWVWGADVAGLLTALGVTSIVIGLALQNAVGSVISGLLLLFEQPFDLGDWLDTGSVRGRVVQVNWRAVHIDTGNGIQIVPNASLADSSFTNLTEVRGRHTVTVPTAFAADDPPDEVVALLQAVARDLPMLSAESSVQALHTAPKTYETTIPLSGPAMDAAARSTFLRWLWYAARRAGLHLDGAADTFSTDELTEQALRSVAGTLHLTPDDVPAIAPRTTMERYGAGETMQRANQVPDGMRFVTRGEVTLAHPLPDGASVTVDNLESGEYLGQTALTREATLPAGTALTEVEVLRVPRDVVDALVRARPALARDIGIAIDQRRERASRALADAGINLAATRPPGSRRPLNV